MTERTTVNTMKIKIAGLCGCLLAAGHVGLAAGPALTIKDTIGREWLDEPIDPRWDNGLAVTYALMGHHARALLACCEAIRLDPEDPEFCRTRGTSPITWAAQVNGERSSVSSNGSAWKPDDQRQADSKFRTA